MKQADEILNNNNFEEKGIGVEMKKMKFIASTVAAAVFVMFCTLAAFAQSSNKMPDIDDNELNLTIHFYVQNIGVDVPISGAEVAIYKVAQLECHGGSAEYALLPKYSQLRIYENGKDVTFDGMSVSAADAISKNLAELVEEPDFTGVTDSSGDCVFDNIPRGMYLVRELSAKGDAEKYELISPYIISVPLGVQDPDGNSWEYDILSQPKTKIIQKKDSDSDENSDSDKKTHTDSDTGKHSDSDKKIQTDSDTDKHSDSDKNTHTDSDITIDTDTDTVGSPDTDTETDSDKASSAPSKPSSDSDKKTVSSGKPTPTGVVSQTGSAAVRESPFISKVKTGIVTNTAIFFMIMFASAFIIVIFSKKRGEDEEDEKKLS